MEDVLYLLITFPVDKNSIRYSNVCFSSIDFCVYEFQIKPQSKLILIEYEHLLASTKTIFQIHTADGVDIC